MRFLIGIMHCIENEFEACQDKLKRQDENAEVFILSGLSNRVAHHELYNKFSQMSAEFDFFVKVDADMVLRSDRFLTHVKHCFDFWPEVTHIEFPVFDHFTKRNIYGLHAWRSCHRWELQGDESIFVDQANGVEIRSRLGLETPAVADHCPDPSPFQAYHFGIHKAVKVMQPGSVTNEIQALSHWRNFRELEAQYLRDKSMMTALPVLGFLDAIANRWGPNEVDFSCIVTNKKCRELESKCCGELEKRILRDYGMYSRRWVAGRLRMFLARQRCSTLQLGERLKLLSCLIGK